MFGILAYAIAALAVLAVVFWIGLAYWVNKDARRRIHHPSLVGVATVVGLVPYVGPVVYLLFRPAETRDEARSRRAELAALEAQVAQRQPTCPECSAQVEADFLVCPICTTRLRAPCAHCDAPLERLWQTCPYCATPVVEAGLDLDEALVREVRSLERVADSAPPQAVEVLSRRADSNRGPLHYE